MKGSVLTLVIAMVLAFEGNSFGQATPATTLLFSQVAVGGSSGYRFVTQIILTNFTTGEARGGIGFITDAATGMVVDLRNLSSGSSSSGSLFDITIPAFSTRVFEASSSGAVTSGWAYVSTRAVQSAPNYNNVKIAGTAAFLLRDPNGGLITSAGVGSSALMGQFSVAALQQRPDLRTGIAIANFGTSATLTFELYNSTGTRTQTVTRTLPSLGHIAGFVDELFSLSLPNILDISTVRVTSSVPASLAALALQFTGSMMTTFPVIAESATALPATDPDVKAADVVFPSGPAIPLH